VEFVGVLADDTGEAVYRGTAISASGSVDTVLASDLATNGDSTAAGEADGKDEVNDVAVLSLYSGILNGELAGATEV